MEGRCLGGKACILKLCGCAPYWKVSASLTPPSVPPSSPGSLRTVSLLRRPRGRRELLYQARKEEGRKAWSRGRGVGKVHGSQRAHYSEGQPRPELLWAS